MSVGTKSTSIKNRLSMKLLGEPLLHCEVCGHSIFGDPFRAVIEGANMTVCSKCSKLGSGYWEPKPNQREKKGINRRPIQYFTMRKTVSTMPETLELIENVGRIVRKARENMGYSHDDLGRIIRERVSVLRKIESGKLVPDLGLAEKLEHVLKIKLRVPPSEPKTQLTSTSKAYGKTLGDLINFNVKQEEAEK